MSFISTPSMTDDEMGLQGSKSGLGLIGYNGTSNSVFSHISGNRLTAQIPKDQMEKFLAMHRNSSSNAAIYIGIVLLVYIILLTILLCRNTRQNNRRNNNNEAQEMLSHQQQVVTEEFGHSNNPNANNSHNQITASSISRRKEFKTLFHTCFPWLDRERRMGYEVPPIPLLNVNVDIDERGRGGGVGTSL